MCKDIHLQSTSMAERFEAALKRKVYNTPKSFLDFINLFK
jgi:dynein heavy chain